MITVLSAVLSGKLYVSLTFSHLVVFSFALEPIWMQLGKNINNIFPFCKQRTRIDTRQTKYKGTHVEAVIFERYDNMATVKV